MSWLLRIFKTSDYGAGSSASPSGGAGGDLGVASDYVLGLPGGTFFDQPEDRTTRRRRNRRKTNGIYKKNQ